MIFQILCRICMRSDCAWSDVYEYVFDRLRAVRQDMVIQEVDCASAVHVLQTAVAFHVYAGYRYGLSRNAVTSVLVIFQYN